MFLKSGARQTHSVSDCLLRNASTPFLHDALPRHARGNLLKNIRNKNPSPPKSGLSVADLPIRNNKSANHFLAHFPIIVATPADNGNFTLESKSARTLRPAREINTPWKRSLIIASAAVLPSSRARSEPKRSRPCP